MRDHSCLEEGEKKSFGESLLFFRKLSGHIGSLGPCAA